MSRTQIQEYTIVWNRAFSILIFRERSVKYVYYMVFERATLLALRNSSFVGRHFVNDTKKSLVDKTHGERKMFITVLCQARRGK